MAIGEFADCIYDLIDTLGGETDDVLTNLIQFLPGDTLREFVDDYTRNNGIMGYEQHELCMDCQESYDVNQAHTCIDDEVKDKIFFSARIPEC